MKRYLVLFLVGLIATHASAVTTKISSPQSALVGARAMSLGGPNPVLVGDINSIFINPAVVADVQSMPFTITSQKLLGEFDYLFTATSIPIGPSVPVIIEDEVYQQKLVLGLSYGSIALSDIPITEKLSDDVIDQTGRFSSGFRVFGASLGTTFYDQLGFDSISGGVGLKAVNHFVAGSNRVGFGIDVGAIARYNLDYWIIDRLFFGASAHNVFSTPLVWSDTGDKSILPLEIYVGARADLFNDRASVFINNGISGISIGAEYRLDGFQLRGSTNGSVLSLGTGLFFGQVSGFGANTYNMRLDYNITQNPDPFNDEVSHAISLTVLGVSRPYTPRILSPNKEFLTSKKTVDLVGVGPKSTSMQFYTNGQLMRTTQTNHQGKWKIDDYPLKEGRNEIYAQSYEMADELSDKSDKLIVTLDTIPPRLDVAVYPDGVSLVVVAVTDDDVDKMIGALNDDAVEFYSVSKGVWEARFQKPEDLHDGAYVSNVMHKLDVAVIDKAGNEKVLSDIPFFATIQFPADKQVQLTERVRILGTASPMVKGISFAGKPVYIDQNKRFSFNYDLVPGKNLVKMKITTLNDESFTQTMRVLRLKTFDDLTDTVRGRRAIELMATLGVLQGDERNRFNPDAYMTRGELAKMIAVSLKFPINKNQQVFFSDVPASNPNVPYIQVMIENGIMFGKIDGSFGLTDALTLDEILSAMSSAGMISLSSDPDVGEQLITKADLARFLSFLPEYERAIEDMVNFEKGYR